MAQASVIPREYPLDKGLYNVEWVNIHNIDFPEQDKTLLTRAVLLADFHTVQVLLEMGANPNGTSAILLHERNVQMWEPPLVTAARLGHLAIVEALTSRGAMLEIGDSSNGRTALYWACARGNVHVVKFLVGSGANVNQKNNYSDTPIVEPLVHKKLDLAIFLLQNGLDLNIVVNYDRDTALIFAVCVGMLNFAVLLIRAGADTTPLNREYEDALAMALCRASDNTGGSNPDPVLQLVFTTLLASGARVKPIHLRLAKSCPGALWVEPQLLHHLLNPKSLLQSSVQKIRSALCANTNQTITPAIDFLPLPKRLRDYVKLEIL